MSVKDRMIDFISQLDQGGQNWFEEKVGLSRGFVNKIGDSIRKKSIDKIRQHFPELNPSWLLTGEGNMLLTMDKTDSITQPKKPNQVPFHQDVALSGGAVEVYNGKSYSPIFINLGDAFNDATGAMQVSGHSMYPNYESGSIVGYREVQDKTYFIPGEVYIIGTADYQMLKRVQRSDREDRVLLISDNDEPGKHGKPKYEPFELEIDKIRFMAIVLGKISRTQMKLMLSNS